MRPVRHKRLLLLAAGAVVLALLVAAPVAVADVLTPEEGSPNAEDIDELYKITFYIGIAIFLGVEGALIWALVKFRARRGGPPAQQIHGNTPLEIGWTLGAGAIVLVLAAVTFVYLDDIKNPPASDPDGLQVAGGVHAAINQPPPPGGDALKIRVNGQQFLWRFDYPGEQQLFTYHTMVVPVDTTVTLDITSQDVIHSWWIPGLGGKADAVPGHVNESWFKIDEPGTYSGICAELCGEGHADMRAVVQALPVDEYERWAAEQAREIEQAQQALADQRRELQEER